MDFDAVLFDLFGTLVDYLTREEFGKAHAEIARVLDVPPDRFRQVWRGTLPSRDVGTYGSLEGDIRFVAHLLARQPTPEQIAEAMRIRLDVYRRCLAPREGALETLAELRSRGFRIGVVSDCASEIPLLWPETPLAGLVDAAVFSCEAQVAKPDPAIYYLACRRLGVWPERCLYVGDGGGRELTGAAGVGMYAALIRVLYSDAYDVHRLDAGDWAGPAVDHLREVLPLAGEAPCRPRGGGLAGASAGSGGADRSGAGDREAHHPTTPPPHQPATYLAGLPKVELHTHLEGAISPEALLGVFRRHGNPEMTCLEDVLRLYRHEDFQDFLGHFRYILQWLKSADDFEPITYDYLASLARQNVCYAEVTFSPGALAHYNGLDCDATLDAVRRGYARARAESGIEMALILDLVRNMGVENGWEMARFAARARDRGVVGINLGGNERDFPAAPFAPVYRWAADQGLRLTAHAGEGAGPESVWDCIRLLGVERIGHGVRMEDDPALVEHVAEHGIAVECCPWSNVMTGAVASLAEHPVRRWFERGIRLSVSSDDPTLFGTTLTQELERLQAVHGFTDADLHRLQVDAVGASFLPEEGKARLMGLLQREAPQLI